MIIDTTLEHQGCGGFLAGHRITAGIIVFICDRCHAEVARGTPRDYENPYLTEEQKQRLAQMKPAGEETKIESHVENAIGLVQRINSRIVCIRGQSSEAEIDGAREYIITCASGAIKELMEKTAEVVT